MAALTLAYAGLFAADYPPISGIEDETGFLNQALVWSRGAVSSEGAGFGPGLADFIEVGGRHVPARHPGRSLVALPFLAAGGTRAVFASGLLIHLATALAGAALLAKLGRSPLWAVLILFHPTLALYSRTVTADGAAGLGVLLAGLAAASDAPVRAGLAVGLAAAMRYHAALALPFVAGAFARGPRGSRGVALCLAAGGAVGCVLVGYNLAVYGTPGEPFTRNRGTFSASAFAANLAFYAAALTVVWPGMSLAPWLDRSRLRWLVRGTVAVFLGPLLFYYFHDVGPGRLETWVVGQRLLQVGLPLWVVSYAGVVDDRIAGPARRLAGGRVGAWVVAAVCLGLLGSTALAFSRHQRHLRALAEARDAFVARVPAGSLVVFQGAIPKVVGTPLGLPEYRLRPLEYQGEPKDDPSALGRDLDAERRTWFLAVLRRAPGDPAPASGYGRALVRRYGMTPVVVGSPLLGLFAAKPQGTP